jgi:TetR/AcrR family transcriptional repressor of nem operon
MAGVRQFDEDRVVDAVLDVFWRKGLRETTMQDLAEAANVQRGSLYNAYKEKDALFLLAFDRYASRFIRAAESALASADDASALSAFFEIAIANMTDGTPPRGCLTTRTALEMTSASGQVHRRIQALLEDLEEMLRKAFSREDMRQHLTLEPSQAALVVVTFMRGLAVMERAFQNPTQLREAADGLVKVLFADGSRRERKPKRPQVSGSPNTRSA